MIHSFSYCAPSSLDELLSVLAENVPGARVLAGGTDLLVDARAGKIAPSLVIDVKRVEELREVGFSLDEGLSVGAAVTLTEICEHGFINSDFELLADAAWSIASKQIRNRATAVGNICTGSPAGDMGPALLAFDAVVRIASVRGRREIPISSFFKGVRRNDLAQDEIVTSVLIPNRYSDFKGRTMKLKRIKGHDLAIVSAAVLAGNGVIRLAAGSCAPCPVFLGEFPVDADVEEIVESALSKVSPIDDIRASADYRRFMLGEYVRRLVAYAKDPEEE